MPTSPEAPAAVFALADTEPSVEPPQRALPSAPAPAPERARRALAPLVLMVLSALLVIVIGVLVSR